MDKDKVLDEIFNNDPLGLLNYKAKVSTTRTADERLQASFQEINDFVTKKGKEPEANMGNISEFQLYSRLKSLREDEGKIDQLRENDMHKLLPATKSDQVNDPQENYEKPKEIDSIDDIFKDDLLDILDDDSEGLFVFKHTPKDYDRAKADYIARRKPCKDFDQYESVFEEVQKDLANGKRKLVDFKEDNLREGDFYVHNGILFLLESINISQKEQTFTSGKRVRKDGRTKCIFENGTMSNMLYRSLAKILYVNGKVVTQNMDKVNVDFIENFSNITDEDEKAGYIYVLKSRSADEKITSIKHLFKIGFTKTSVKDRIKNAENQPTYLMAPVIIEGVWDCYNMNPHTLEQLLHNFFGKSCLNIDVFDKNRRRHSPKEWFIAPIEVIEQAIELIINGKIINYRYEPENMVIVKR